MIKEEKITIFLHVVRGRECIFFFYLALKFTKEVMNERCFILSNYMKCLMSKFSSGLLSANA